MKKDDLIEESNAPHYDLLFDTTIMADDAPRTFGKSENRTCRICHQTKPNVSFKKVAHIFPAALGCKRALTYEECDSCNTKFGNKVEPHLVDFLGPRRVASKIPKRKGHPKHKDSNLNQSFHYEDSDEFQGWIAHNQAIKSIDRENRLKWPQFVRQGLAEF